MLDRYLDATGHALGDELLRPYLGRVRRRP
jgi:hypothetical protein